ncbi:transposase [Rhizobium leguminosarum]
MTKQHIEVITSVERRRHWSREEKERMVAAALEPGTVVSDVARSPGIHLSQLFRWKSSARYQRRPCLHSFRLRSWRRCHHLIP